MQGVQWFRWLVVAGLFFMLLIFGLLASDRLAINGNQSLPGQLYWLSPLMDEDRLKHGDIVAFIPPENRFYPSGRRFLKLIRGIPGDHVVRIEQNNGQSQFLINGAAVGLAKTETRLGSEKLLPGPVGEIPEGQYFVWTPHVDSYDSRYADIGWVDLSAITARAYRLF